MPAADAGDVTLWRTAPYGYTGYVFVHAPTSVFSGQINQSNFVYPLRTVTVDTTSGSHTAVQSGMTLLLGSSAGADDLGRARIISATSTTLTFARASRGISDGEMNFSDNAYFTVLNEYRVWAKIPRITTSGVTYKDGDTAWVAANAQPPVANGGTAVAGFVDDITGELEVDFASASYAIASSASISSVAWDFADGTPSSSTSATVTGVTFPAGFRYVKLTVTDSNSKTHTTRIPVYAAERTGTYAPKKLALGTQTLSADGQTFSCTLIDTLSASTYPNNALVIYFEEELYGSTAGSLGSDLVRDQVKFVGWIDTEPKTKLEATPNGWVTEVSFTCIDVLGRLKKLPGFSQEVARKTSPGRWEQMANPNVWRLFHYILHWHSTALEVAPLTQSTIGATYPFKSLGVNAQTLYAQCDYLARAIGYRFTCTMRGKLYFLPDPQLAPTSAQVTEFSLSIATRTSTAFVSLTEADLRSFEYDTNRPPRQHWLKGEAIVASSTAITSVFCTAPGSVPGQGTSGGTQGEQLVTKQNELNVRIGHAYRRANAWYTDFVLSLVHTGDLGIDPAYMEWLPVTVGAGYAAKRGVTFSSAKLLPSEVRIQHTKINLIADIDTYVKDVTVSAELEVQGTAAQTYYPPKDKGTRLPEFTLPSIAFPTLFPPLVPSVMTAGRRMGAVFADGGFALTESWDMESPFWTLNAASGFSGTASQWCVDALDLAAGWLVTPTDIYKVSAITTAPTAVSQKTITGTANANIDFAYTGSYAGLFGIVAYAPAAGGTKYHVTTDGGATWSAVATLGTNSTVFAPGLQISAHTAGKAWMAAFDIALSPQYTRVYVSTDFGGSWTVDSALYSDDFSVVIHQPYTNTAETRMFIGYDNSDPPYEDPAPYANQLRRGTVNGSMTNISPEYSGTRYGADQSKNRFTISTASNNADRLLMAAKIGGGTGESGIAFTANREATTPDWTWLVEPTVGNTYKRGVLLDPDGALGIIFGTGASIAAVDCLNGVVSSRVGNLSSLTSAEIIGVFGW